VRARSVLSLAVLIVSCAVAVSGRPYQFMQTDRNVALFENATDLTLVGLRVVFTGDVDPLQVIGIGAEFELASNEAGVLVYEGAVVHLGVFEIDWALDGPAVHAAFWVDADGLEYEIDVHSPHARMWYELPPGTDEWADGCAFYIPIEIEFDGHWSKDPDRLALVRHQWSWSDGLALEGETVVRTFRTPGTYTVILTAWDVQGLPDSTTSSFHVYRYRCEEE